MIDDGSTDNSHAVLDKYAFIPGLKSIRLSKNEGFANALNRGINESSSKYIFRSDPDDYMVEDRIERQYNFLESNQDVDLVGSNVYYYHEGKQAVVFKSNMPRFHNEIVSAYMKGNHGLFHTTVAGKAGIFKQLMYKQSFYPAEDYDFFSRAAASGYVFSNLPDTLVYYRLHSNNLYDKYLEGSVLKTIQARKEVFGIQTNQVRTKLLYYQKLCYRRSLASEGIIHRYIYRVFSTILRPIALIRRISFSL